MEKYCNCKTNDNWETQVEIEIKVVTKLNMMKSFSTLRLPHDDLRVTLVKLRVIWDAIVYMWRHCDDLVVMISFEMDQHKKT